MAPPIVSWSDNEIWTSPVLSSATSIISFDSTFSDTYPSHTQTPPTASEPPGLPNTEFGAKQTSLPGFSEGIIPRCGQATSDNSFIRHDLYFFKDGNVTFLVDGTLYCVHRYFFARDSVYFSTRFARLDIRNHEALSTIISINDVERKDFEALLSVLYPANFEAHELTYEQWKSVLHLSTRWGFASLRELALKSIKPPTSHDQFVIARTYSVNHWILPALTALCGRSFPLSLDEARQMSMEDVILVARVREEIRGGALRVDVADIPRHVEVAQSGKLNGSTGNDVYLDRPKSGQESNSTKNSAVNPSIEAEGAMAMGVTIAPPPGPQQKATKEVDTNVEPQTFQSKVPVEPPGVEYPHVVKGASTGSKSGESQLLPLMGEALPADTQGPQEVAHTREHLMARTDVPLVADVATATPTTVSNSRSDDDAEKAADDEWGIPVKTKKKKGTNTATPVTPSAGGWDEWATGGAVKKKKRVKPLA